MIRRWMARLPRAASLLTLFLLTAGLSGTPALSDPVGGAVPSSIHLSTPFLYLALAPLFSLWDGVSLLSMSRLKGFLAGLALLYGLWRVTRAVLRGKGADHGGISWRHELKTLVTSVALLVGFVVVGALWHRPMLSLAGVPPEYKVVDFHSHTNVSHDVRNTLMRGFDVEANRRWHARAGFDLFFVTDHNTVEGLRTARPLRKPVWCPGIEVSAWRSHIVLLGDTLPVDRSRYNGSLDELLTLLRTSEQSYGSPSLASLPEYLENHWPRLDSLIAAGVDGFEIVNASPKANEIRLAQRDTVIALARRHNRFVAGVSDSHGWGATSMVWNLVSVPGGSTAEQLCNLVENRLRLGFPAVRVLERHRVRPDSWWPQWLTPLAVVWETWRSMGWALTASWLIWIWAIALWRRRAR